MKCGEVRDLAPLYLSGEMTGEQRQRFDAHLAACPECEEEMDRQALLDARVAGALWRESPNTTRVEQRVRQQISAGRSRRRWIAAAAMAASITLAVAGSYELLHVKAAPRLYTDAANDHWTEIVERQPRRWRSEIAEIEVLTAQNGLSFSQVAALAPAGYSLERARICLLDGERMLHLVFTNSRREYSVYVSSHQGVKEGVRIIRCSSEEVAAFETGQFRVVVVTDGPAAECEHLARSAEGRL